MSTMHLLLIGSGSTGKSITENLLKLNGIEQISIYNRTMKSAQSIAATLNDPKIKVIQNLENLREYDYIIIALSGMSESARHESFFKNKNTYDIRQDELKYNLGAIAGLVPYLKKSPKNNIIVITNPVDEITNYLRITLGRKNIFGFGLDLDAKRYSAALSKSVMCIGPHGKAVPLINAKSEKEYDEVHSKVDASLLQYIRQNGIPHEAAGKAFCTFFEKLSGSSKETIHMAYYLGTPFSGIEDISISMPWIVQGGKVLKLAEVKANKIEKKRFQQSAKELKKSIKHILKTHKSLVSYK